MKIKKVPLRKCLSCNEMKDKKNLIRVVKNKDGEVLVDDTGKLNGRGAYICKNTECLNDVIKNNKLSKGLKAKVEPEVYENLKSIIESE